MNLVKMMEKFYAECSSLNRQRFAESIPDKWTNAIGEITKFFIWKIDQYLGEESGAYITKSLQTDPYNDHHVNLQHHFRDQTVTLRNCCLQTLAVVRGEDQSTEE